MKIVKPYHLDGSKKEQVAKMFNSISKRYDFLNRFLSLGIDINWRNKTVQFIKTTGAKSILDVATGTADLAISLRNKIPDSKITGIDISSGMLEVGQQKITRRKLDSNISLILGDGEALPFPDHSYDAVTVAFGVRNFENLENGLLEIQRVLKPGGSVGVLEFSKPEKFPFKQIYFFYFKYILPTVGRIVSKDPSAYSYLPASVEEFPYGQNFITKLSDSGFINIKAEPLTFGVASLYTAHTSKLN
ncbi:MAG: Demethylmenaquinone methyltransferase [Owenweeksia sp. TMED14]|nr:MAG: Demethylmenaquinone methyltransferase [Owenweeksia sp. TMED14]